MKQLLIKLTLALISMLLGLLLLMTTHQTIPLLSGALLITLGFSYISFITATQLGNYKIYEFRHYYWQSDPITNESIIIKELNYAERTQLKYYDSDVFINNPILVENVDKISQDYCKATGWVKAHNTAEAIRILHYTTDWDELQ